MAHSVRLARAVGVVIVALESASAIEVEASVEPVDDGILVEALVAHAAAEGLPLDEHCVEGIVGGTDVAYLDDELARQALLAGLEFVTNEPSSTELTVGSTVMILDRGFLVFDAPVIVDVEELRRQLLTCVAGPADRELVDQVAALLLARPEYGPFVDDQCVERMLTIFSDQMLRIWVANLEYHESPPTTLSGIDVSDDDLAGLYWLSQCQTERAPHTAQPSTTAG